jgi:metal-responsive CopG/Arc/MetJ family transcriptional regulator
MQTVTFKLQERILHKVDSLMKPLNFNNRTEFIRDAIRDKINKIETDEAIAALMRFKGSAKVKVSDERLHEIREEVAKKYLARLDSK